MITVLCANAGVDKTYEIPNFATGGYYHPESTSTVAGGKGINAARALAALNQACTVMAFAGGNNGRFVAADLMEAGFKTDLVNVAEESRVTINIIDRTQHTQTRVDEVGPLVTPSEVRKLQDRWKRSLNSRAMGIISGSAPRGVSLDLYGELVTIARSMKKPVILDAHDELLVRAVNAQPAVITPNLGEMQRLMGRRLTVPDGVIAAATELVEDGIRVVVVTLGARGAIGTARASGIWWARPPAVDRISDVGCGDAFVAGFATGSMQRRSFEGRLRLAVACGAANAETVGACNITAARVAELEAAVSIERLDGNDMQEAEAGASN